MDERPVLICFDDSVAAYRAIDMAAALLGPRRAVVLEVAPYTSFAESLAFTSSMVPGSTMEQVNQADAQRAARAGAEHARAVGFDAEASGRLGTPTWEAIIDAADEIDASVIVMGSRGLVGPKQHLDGSVSHQVAEHSGRPVLIVPPAERR